jgi:hypothetical protein
MEPVSPSGVDAGSGGRVAPDGAERLVLVTCGGLIRRAGGG